MNTCDKQGVSRVKRTKKKLFFSLSIHHTRIELYFLFSIFLYKFQIHKHLTSYIFAPHLKNEYLRLFFSIFLFTAFAIRPAIEISQVLYYQLHIDSIIEKYCVNKERPQLNCNGKCYLMTQMKMSKTTDNNNTKASILIAETFLPLFFEETTLNIENIPNFQITLLSNWKPIHLHCKAVSKVIDHPPEIYIS